MMFNPPPSTFFLRHGSESRNPDEPYSEDESLQISFVGINSLYGSTSALLLKQSPFIKCLKLFDQRDVESGLDVANINTQCRVKTFQGNEQLENAFREADIIVISDESSEIADSDSHLMNVAANLTKYAKAISRASPDAIIVVASPPINYLLPIMSQLLAKAGCYNHNKVVGSTSVDTMRASALLATHLNMDPKEVVLPVIGGGSELTRVPVFSQSRPHFSLKKDLKNNLIMDIRRGDSLVLANKGSPEALNRAYSTVRFLNTIMAGLRGEPNVTDITLCRTDLVPGVEYFSLPVMFGRDGIIKRFGVPNTSATEDEMVEEAIKNVKKDTDKADYIVKGTAELTEHKYLSANDRASSQKDMFDLFVKCLPKPEGTNLPVPENSSKTATDYSFKSLIKEDTTVDPIKVFDKKSRRGALATHLKHVTSPDSFLKSAGCYTSPLQKPILILEPLGCPSRPVETDEDGELEEFLDAEDVLHENNLARFRDKETYSSRTNFSPSPTKNQPFLSTESVQQKTVDPIANFKAQVAKFHEYKNQGRVADSEEGNTETNLHSETKTVEGANVNTHCDPKPNEMSNASSVENKKNLKSNREIQHTSTPEPTMKRQTADKEQEVVFSSPSGRCMKKRYGSPNKIKSYVFDVKSNRVIPPYNLYKKGKNQKADYIPEEENGTSYMPRSEMEESLYNRGRFDGVENDEKYNKLVSRLFKKLGGLCDGTYFPLKASGEERANAPKCRKSFTESAVRCRSPNSVSLKMPKKHKKSIEAMGMGDEYETQEMFSPKKKTRGSVEKVLQEFRAQSKKLCNCEGTEAAQFKEINELSYSQDQQPKHAENDGAVHFVCPKCQIKITCQPEKKENKMKAQAPETTVNDNRREDDKKRKRNVVMKTYKARNCQAHNDLVGNVTSFESNEQDERLKRLREKINKKLIPMMRQTNQEISTGKDDVSTTSAANRAKEGEMTDSKHHSLGVPLVLGQNSESIPKHTDPKVKSRSEKWQGVPFVVKRNEKKVVNDGKNRAVFMKVVIPPAYREENTGNNQLKPSPIGNSKGIEKNAVNVIKDECKTTEETKKTAEGNGKASKRAAKVLNKLQLLELEGTRKMNLEETTKCEVNEKEVDKFHKERIRREISVDLNAEEVRNYMMTRQRGSRKVLVRESNNRVEAKSELVDEQVDPEHLKSQTARDISPDIFSEPTKLNDPAKTVTASGASGSTEKDSVIECIKAVDRGTNSANTEASKDCGNTKETEKKTHEPSRTMTCPSKQFENIEEPILQASHSEVKPSMDAPKKNLHPEPKLQQVVTKSTQKSPELAKPSEPSSVLFHRTPNKLQLLAKARTSKYGEENAIKIKLQRKIKNAWEKVLSTKPVTAKFEPVELPKSLKNVGAAFEKLDKRSAAVKIAKNSFDIPKKANSYRTNGVPNNVPILKGLTFPVRRKRKPTHNLLKELASVSKRGETVKAKPKVNLNKVTKRIPVKLRGHKGMKPGSLDPENSEYTKDDMHMAKLASEIIKKKALRSAFDGKSRNGSNGTTEDSSRIKRPVQPKSFVSLERPRSLLELMGKDRKGQSGKKTSDVLNKLMSMPHVRHLVENFEMPLGPLEVQPGLSQFNYTKVGIFSPMQSPIINEYSRSNALPSLRDTRETFHLEEYPS